MPISSALSHVPQRWIVCALCSLAFGMVGFKNVCYLEISLVARSFEVEKKTPTGGCPYFYSGCAWERRKLKFYLPSVYWNIKVLDMVDSIYYIGKLLMVVPAGMLSDLGYSRQVFGGGMFLMTVTQLLLPTTVELGVIAIMLSNIIEGVGEATLFPSVVSMVSRWAHSSERNTFSVLILGGYYYGSVLGHIFSTLIIIGSISWTAAKYTNGIVGIVWLMFWFIFGYHSPVDSPFVPPSEHVINAHHERRSLLVGYRRLSRIPWRKIVTSPSFLSLVLLFCSVQWAVFANIDGILETYQEYILHLPEEFNKGSSIVVIAALPSSLLGGLFTDWAIKNNLTTKTTIKRILAFQSVFWSSVLLVTATFVGCNYILFWVLTITAVYAAGLSDSTTFSTPIDLSPRQAGLLMGIMVAVRTIFTLFNLRIDAELVPDPFDPNRWRYKSMFYSLLAIVFMIPFLVFGSGEKLVSRRRSSLGIIQPPVELEVQENQITGNSNNSPENK